MKSRVRGIEAQKANIQAARAVARTLRSSLGPKVRATTKKSRRENPQPPFPTTLPSR